MFTKVIFVLPHKTISSILYYEHYILDYDDFDKIEIFGIPRPILFCVLRRPKH